MSLLYVESFAHLQCSDLDLKGWVSDFLSTSYLNLSPSWGRYGQGGLQLYDSGKTGGNFKRPLGSNCITLVMGCNFYLNTSSPASSGVTSGFGAFFI